MRVADLRVRLPGALIPDHHRAGAIALVDRPLEGAVLEWMVLDLNREALVGRIQRGAACDGPGLHHTIELQPEVIVQAPCRVLLHDEAEHALACIASLSATLGLGRAVEVAFGVVAGKWIGSRGRLRGGVSGHGSAKNAGHPEEFGSTRRNRNNFLSWKFSGGNG